MVAQVELKLGGEKVLYQEANPKLLAYCPSMELLALGSINQQVTVYRLNGQKVYAATQKGGSRTLERICWKPNGKLLAVAWSDGIVRLMGAESNKTVHQLPNAIQDGTGITCLAWVANITSKKSAGHWPAEGAPSWKEIFETHLGVIEEDSLDLPRDLSLIDIESSLPKLSVLPAGGTSEDIFSSRASLDGLFRAFDPKDNDVVDVMVVGTTDGRIHLSIYDSFVVGSFVSPLANPDMGEYGSRLILHASHKLYSTHALLMSPSSQSTSELCYVPMDLRFISSSSDYLSLLASRSTTLQNLLRYIHQVQTLMTAEWQASQDLPNKFLKNINETLQEKNNCTIVQAMYHSAATGHTFPVVREWLVNELAERGHKRWDKAVTSGLENLRKLVHEDMLPALDRCALILSRLSGIIKYQGPNESLGFSNRQISLVMDTVACLKLVAVRILTYVVEELDLFVAFSGWLRHEIDRLASDTSSTSEDVPEKEAIIDHSRALRYIQKAMMTSRLSIFFQESVAEGSKNEWATAEQGLPLFELLDQQLRKHQKGTTDMTSLPKVDLLCKHLDQQANAVFRRIADAEKRNVLFGQPVRLGGVKRDGPVAMILCPEDAAHYKIYIAYIDSEQFDKVRIICIKMRIKNGISNRTSIQETAVSFNGNEILDIAFWGNCSAVVMHAGKGEKPSLLSIPCRDEDTILSYIPSPVSATAATAHSIGNILTKCVEYSFPGGSFVPYKFELSERSQQKLQSESARFCVLDKDRLHYRIFSLPKACPVKLDTDSDVAMM